MTKTTLFDLLVPLRCAGCDGVGSAWCASCARLLADPFPVGAGRYALARYAGEPRRAVIALKERDRRDLIVPLGRALAAALPQVSEARAAPDGRWLLVPAPSRPAANRRRWGGHLPAVARACARALCRAGQPAVMVPALRLDRRAKDSVGFDAAARRANLAGRVHVVRSALPPRGSPVVLLDDVITTGATAAACKEALRGAGVRVSATLAITAALAAR